MFPTSITSFFVLLCFTSISRRVAMHVFEGGKACFPFVHELKCWRGRGGSPSEEEEEVFVMPQQ